MNAKNPSAASSPAGGRTQTQRMDAASETLADLAGILDQYLADLQAGRTPDRARLQADHPGLAPQLAQALDGLEFIHRSSAATPAAPSRLGDFRIVREVGRGGMGVVYEAEQISLRRRVAVKVLRFGAVADETAMQRFQREAETVAHLHHTNIVPIFAIGAEAGVHYYAMQFIEGRDLSELARRGDGLGDESGPLEPRRIADWGLQAAEALAHAHRRGVIHRDIKPSNLILDHDGRIWLTDFGLARRVDDVVLSVAGALLGTPRYMSPEQARASKDPVDHRTDIYSLGATLYELATGRPIFDASTAHEVLSQILNNEPRAPRLCRPDLPRDFETIILKCLAKEPSRRYATTQALADDLRAFLEGRPISARAPSLPQRVARWVRKHRRTTAVAAVSAGVSLVLAIAGYLVWLDRQQARLARLSLSTDTPNLIAEIVDAQGQTRVPAFPAPSADPVTVPAGRHQLRLSASGMLSETWPVEFAARRDQSIQVQLQPRWLWPPGEVNTAEYPKTQVVTLREHADLLVLASSPDEKTGAGMLQRVRLLDGATGKPAWSGDLIFDANSLPPGGSIDEWRALLAPSGLAHRIRDTGLRQRTHDLNGDGIGDPVLLSRTTPSLVAISGLDGEVLWWARARPVLETPARADAESPRLERAGHGFVVGVPTVADVDGDGTPDFLACFHFDGDTYAGAGQAPLRTGPQSGLAAISGRTGELLWQRPVAEDWSQFVNSSAPADKYQALCRPAIGQVNGRTVVGLVEKSRLLGFDTRTGDPAWPPLELGFEPHRAPEFADLDGDGESEAVFLRWREDAAAGGVRRHRAFAEESSLDLHAVSLPGGQTRWNKAFGFAPKWQAHELKRTDRHFTALLNLNNDGRPEILLSSGHRTLRGGTRLTLELVDGATGTNRWHRLLYARDLFGPTWNADPFVAGPDLDGDGWREVFVAWEGHDEASRKHGLFVAALSGADGRWLWRAHQPGLREASALAWWHAGADGWPMLLVSAQRASGGQYLTLALGAGSGRIEHTLPDVAEPQIADFDGDGIADLFYTVSPQGAPRNLVVRGVVPDVWKQLGDWRAAADFNQDGFTDLIGIEDAVLTARSGRDGQILWQAPKAPRAAPMETPQLAGDFNGDGVPDVLAVVNEWRQVQPQGFTSKRLPAAFSGKDGRQLWVADDLDILGSQTSTSGTDWSCRYPLLEWADLSGDGAAELIALQTGPGMAPTLSVAAGGDGRVRWSARIARGGFGLRPSPAGPPLADFNGDRVRDFALWLPEGEDDSAHGPLRLNVLDGHTGQPLWTNPTVTVHHPARLIYPEPAVADLDSDGVPEVLVSRHGGFNQQTRSYQCELLAVNGRDGLPRWTWEWQAGSPQMWPPVIFSPVASGSPMICLVVMTKDAPTLVALDVNGREILRRQLNLRGSQLDYSRHVWRAADVDGDGRQELVYLDAGRLCVAGGEGLELRWNRTLPDAATRLADVRAAAPGMRATLTVWTGVEALGLDGATGQPLWRARVGTAPHPGTWENSQIVRLSASETDLPRLQHLPSGDSGYRTTSVVGQAWPVAPGGQYVPPKASPRAYPPLPSISLPQRRLPWAQSDVAIILSGAVTLLLVGLPALLVAWAVRWRSWSLGLLPLGCAGLSLLLPWRAVLPGTIFFGYAVWLAVWAARARRWPVAGIGLAYAALAVAILFSSMQPTPLPGQPPWRVGLEMALLGVPALVFWAMCAHTAWQRRWRRLQALIISCLIASAAAGTLLLLTDRSPHEAGDNYAWSGAYPIVLIGASLTGLGGLVALVWRKAADGLRWWRGQERPAPNPAQ
jgi:serine/threonine protein kinase/outer membrane protein assembly factor BamB